MDTPENRDIVGKLLDCGAIILPNAQPEWRESRIDQQQRDYILDREDAIRASIKIAQIPWQNIDCLNKKLAEQIRENALHSLGVLLESMRKNEEKMM